MDKFIAKMIETQADISLEKGQDKYRAYFITTLIYAKWKESVDSILTADGYANCIVKK